MPHIYILWNGQQLLLCYVNFTSIEKIKNVLNPPHDRVWLSRPLLGSGTCFVKELLQLFWHGGRWHGLNARAERCKWCFYFRWISNTCSYSLSAKYSLCHVLRVPGTELGAFKYSIAESPCKEGMITALFQRWGDWGSERLSKLLRAHSWLTVDTVWFHRPYFPHHPILCHGVL